MHLEAIEAIRCICGGHQRPSDSHQRHSEAIRDIQRPSEAIRGIWRPSEAIRGIWRPAEADSCGSPHLKLERDLALDHMGSAVHVVTLTCAPPFRFCSRDLLSFALAQRTVGG